MDNLLKKIFPDGLPSLSSIFGKEKSSKSTLGIDIGSSFVKVVQLKKKGGGAVIETYGELALGPYGKTDVGAVTNLAPADIARALVDVLRESNVTIHDCSMAIPSSASLIFTITLPGKITEDQLANIVPNEARKYIPVPISEVTLDWFMIPSESMNFDSSSQDNFNQNPQMEQKVEVLVVAIHNEILTKYQTILKDTSLISNSFEMEIFSAIRSSFNHELAPVLLMDFGASKTKLSIIESGIVRIFHVVNRGSQDITKNIAQSLGISFAEAEKRKREVGLDMNKDKDVASIVQLSVDYIFSDTNNVVLAYEKKYNKNISKVVMIGGGSLISGLVEYSASSFNIEVTHSDPFSKIDSPAFLSSVLKESGPEFANAVGLALRQLS